MSSVRQPDRKGEAQQGRRPALADMPVLQVRRQDSPDLPAPCRIEGWRHGLDARPDDRRRVDRTQARVRPAMMLDVGKGERPRQRGALPARAQRTAPSAQAKADLLVVPCRRPHRHRLVQRLPGRSAIRQTPGATAGRRASSVPARRTCAAPCPTEGRTGGHLWPDTIRLSARSRRSTLPMEEIGCASLYP
jgi:hypothetical protein